MKIRRLQFGLPLLTKELIEMANRRRTYVIRTLYALLFLGFVGFIYIDLMSSVRNNPLAILGRGRELFEYMVFLQFAAIYLFLPAITCGVITQEKERNSLGLLLITRLSPGTIILEKYLGRLITMASFLMLGLPILAFAYALGGISPSMFITGLWLLILAMLQIAALGICCSSFFRTTVSAFIGSYLIGFGMLFGPGIAYELNLLYYRELFSSIVQLLQEIPVLNSFLGNLSPRWEELNVFLFPPFWFAYFTRTGGLTSITGPLLVSVSMLFNTLVLLGLAHFFLVRRAFLPPRNLLLKVFKNIDRLFVKINENRVTRGIVLVKDEVRLPEINPIAWRETSKKSLGTFRYLFRILVSLEVPILLLCIVIAISNPEPVVPGAVVLYWCLWGLTVLLLAVSATSLIAGERSHETLDVLLTTPISGKALLQQKIAGVRRLCLVLLIPLLTIVFFETWWKWEYSLFSTSSRFKYSLQWLPYLAGSLLTLAIYLPMLIYLFCWIGMKIKSQNKAILTALGSVILWCLLPFILAFPAFALYPSLDEYAVLYGLFLGPASYVALNEVGEFHEFGSVWIPLIVNTIIYFGCFNLFRSLCLNHIDENLGRLGDEASNDNISDNMISKSTPLVSTE